MLCIAINNDTVKDNHLLLSEFLLVQGLGLV